jgi:hypothetical protein
VTTDKCACVRLCVAVACGQEAEELVECVQGFF